MYAFCSPGATRGCDYRTNREAGNLGALQPPHHMGMAGLLMLLLAGCPLPEDQFVLSGQVTDFAGEARAGVEVRLLRNAVPSDTRCDAFEPLDTTLTDQAGNYAFTLIRQQVTRGITARRFFRVEADGTQGVISQNFWFPDADLALGVLSEQTPAGASRVVESLLDDQLAWRSEVTGARFNFDRSFQLRTALTMREWRTVPIDSLGRYDIVPVEWRFEAPWVLQNRSGITPPQSRGAECPFIGVSPCPLTDGRYLPYVFPPDTRTLVLNFKHETNVSPLSFHGLQLARTAVKVRLEFNFVEDFDNWNTLGSSAVDTGLQELSTDRCNDPGVFFSVGPGSFIKPVLLRIAFVDDAGDLVPIVSLAEVSTP